jgi:hypothetical protein
VGNIRGNVLMAFLRKNFAKGFLASGITALSNQLTVVAGHTLITAAGMFRLVIWDEITYSDPADDPNLEIITASYSGVPNVYNIIRAQESTLAVSHDVGDRCGMHYTAGISMDDLSYGGLHGLYDPDYHSIDIVL